METIKELLLKAGLTRKEAEVGAAALTHIVGDHIGMYESINELCASKDRLGEITSQLSTLSAIVPQKPMKRTYVRKAVDVGHSLVTQAFDANAVEALNDQKPEVPEHLKRPFPKPRRKRESSEEINGAIGDLGQIQLSKEEEAANLKIDL